MNWYQISADEETLKKVQHSFSLLYYFAGLPPKMGLAVNRSSEPFSLYLSPGCFPVAEGIVECYGGKPVNRPDPETLEWLVGGSATLVEPKLGGNRS